MAAWHTPTTVRTVWASAPSGDPLVQDLLDAAQLQILTFIGDDVDESGYTAPTTIPATWRIAHAMQTRALWESQAASTQSDIDQIGMEFPVRVYNMAKPIQDLLLPRHGIPGIG